MNHRIKFQTQQIISFLGAFMKATTFGFDQIPSVYSIESCSEKKLLFVFLIRPISKEYKQITIWHVYKYETDKPYAFKLLRIFLTSVQMKCSFKNTCTPHTPSWRQWSSFLTPPESHGQIKLIHKRLVLFSCCSNYFCFLKGLSFHWLPYLKRFTVSSCKWLSCFKKITSSKKSELSVQKTLLVPLGTTEQVMLTNDL